MRTQVQKHLKMKQQIEIEKETVKPTVINDKLIHEYLLTYNRENKIFDENDKPIWELEHLSLSFKSKYFQIIWKPITDIAAFRCDSNWKS